MEEINEAMNELDDNINEIKQRIRFLDSLQKGAPLIVKEKTNPAYLFTLSDKEEEILKQFSLQRIKELRRVTFVNDKDIIIKI